ncbi:MAG: hypothetical protein KIS79_02920 [Burkholderiales bacterium]|nr:hypothetical protein [Burkholderiales bacterium]
MSFDHSLDLGRAYRSVLVVFLCLASLALTCAAHAEPARDPGRMPEAFNRLACYRMVQHEGRMIAWARWEERLSEEKTRTGGFALGTPPWVMNVIDEWIADAYAWRVTNEQVLHWAQELGNTDALPQAEELSVPEIIAIWMRRIARDCDRRQARA